MSLEPLLRAFFVHTNRQWCLNLSELPETPFIWWFISWSSCSVLQLPLRLQVTSIPFVWVWCLSLASHMREKKWWEKCGSCCCAGEVGNWCEGWVASQGDSCGWSQGHGSLPCHSWQVLWSIILFFILDRLNFSYSHLQLQLQLQLPVTGSAHRPEASWWMDGNLLNMNQVMAGHASIPLIWW